MTFVVSPLAPAQLWCQPDRSRSRPSLLTPMQYILPGSMRIGLACIIRRGSFARPLRRRSAARISCAAPTFALILAKFATWKSPVDKIRRMRLCRIHQYSQWFAAARASQALDCNPFPGIEARSAARPGSVGQEPCAFDDRAVQTAFICADSLFGAGAGRRRETRSRKTPPMKRLLIAAF